MSELRNEAGTPWEIFETLHREYRFDVDICAKEHNAKLESYFTPEDNSLSLHWGGLRVWCNPPFASIPPWLEHAGEGIFTAYFLPARSDREWWREWKPRAECHYLIGEKPHKRPQFIPPPGITYSSNSMCLCLFLFGEGCTPGEERYRSGMTGERL